MQQNTGGFASFLYRHGDVSGSNGNFAALLIDTERREKRHEKRCEKRRAELLEANKGPTPRPPDY
jgi:hypothetical protein